MKTIERELLIIIATLLVSASIAYCGLRSSRVELAGNTVELVIFNNVFVWEIDL